MVPNAEKIYEWLSEVTDPEIPVLTITDMGVVRDVQVSTSSSGKAAAKIVVTPTYSGCPAMDVISMQIRMTLLSKGISEIEIEHQLSPAWTTDWMTDSAKEKLKQYGIAPPQGHSNLHTHLFEDVAVPCPKCESTDTEEVSRFGATSCKALYRCLTCKEPFEYFKCH